MSRIVTTGMLLATAACIVSFAGGARAQTVHIANYGGSFGDALNEVCLRPFSEAGLGYTAEQVVTDNMLAQLKIQVETNNVLWDLAPGAEGEAYITAVTNGWLEKLNWASIDPQGVLPDVAKPEYGLSSGAYSSTLGIRSDKVPAGKRMGSWKDFWDVSNFPGPRSLRNSPVENLEFALMADGVPAADVYKILRAEGGVDRAFKKLDEIKPAITHWWSSAQQPVQGLASGELYFATTFSGRLVNLKTDKVPVEIMWNGGSMNFSPLTIPKGAKNKDGAIAFIKFCYLDPQRGYELVKKTGGGSLNQAVLSKFTDAEKADMPTAPQNVVLQSKLDPQFWYEHRSAIQKRWNEWMLK